MANKLEYFRRRADLTQAELAEKSGVDAPKICRAEKGILDLKGMAWLSIARVLHCTVDELLGRAER